MTTEQGVVHRGLGARGGAQVGQATGTVVNVDPPGGSRARCGFVRRRLLIPAMARVVVSGSKTNGARERTRFIVSSASMRTCWRSVGVNVERGTRKRHEEEARGRGTRRRTRKRHSVKIA